jgi:hypothetical protein
MQLHHLRQDIQKRRSNGETYYSIARVYGINKTMVWQIEHGYVPGKKVSAILALDPGADLKYTRSRRETLNEKARGWGYENWCAYETAVIHGEKE